MIEFEDLDDTQKEALVDAFGQPSDYQEPSLSQIETNEVVKYNNLRSKLEGLSVEQGNMSSDRLDYFLGDNGNILKENDKGNYEINSVWDSWVMEEMEENGMMETDQINLYRSETPEETNINVLEVEDEFYMDIENGLTFSLPKATDIESAEYGIADKIQEMTQDFIEFFSCSKENDEGPVNTGYMNTSSKPLGSNNQGGEQDMTEEYDEVPMTAEHAVAYESHKNLEEHEEVADDELYNLDIHEQVALGAAGVLKGIEEGEYEDIGTHDLAGFIDDYGEEFEEDAFLRYKGQMGGDQYEADIIGNVGDEVDETNDIKQALDSHSVVWEALYREKAADNEESQEIIEGVLNEVSRLDRDDSRLRSSRQGLQIAENTEQRQSQKASDIDDLARNL